MVIYLLWNYDEDYPVFSSTDKGLVEEVMCDYFIEDAYSEFCYNTNQDWLFAKYMLPSDKNEIAKAAYETVLEWYQDYMGILEIPVYE